MAHTPGPWLVEARDGWTLICRGDGAVIARVSAGNEVRANARLIAAAPDLLEVARMVVANYHGGCGAREGLLVAAAAHAAIAKATGGEAQ